MKSIGIWYELYGEEMPQLEFHINLWNLKGNNKSTSPFVDFGISISDFRKIKSLDILLPFRINDSEIIDLYVSLTFFRKACKFTRFFLILRRFA